MLKRVSAFAACLFCVAVLSAQSVDKTVTRSIEKFFAAYTPKTVYVKNCGLERRRNNVVVNKRARKITIYANQNFAAQVFTPVVVQDIYAGIKKALPPAYAKYKIEVVAARRPIEELVPNNLREKILDKNRLWGGVDYAG